MASRGRKKMKRRARNENLRERFAGAEYIKERTCLPYGWECDVSSTVMICRHVGHPQRILRALPEIQCPVTEPLGIGCCLMQSPARKPRVRPTWVAGKTSRATGTTQ